MRRSVILTVIALAIVAAGTWKILSARSRQPNVLVILLDTLRADHMGTYGYERDTSPNLDEFAAKYIKFNFAVTAAPWTPPSVASIFTGQYPTSHSFIPPNSREEAKGRLSVLSPDHETLAEIFKHNGYATAAISPNPWITSTFKFDQGFEKFTYLPRAPAEKISNAARTVLKDLKAQDKPFFMYLHYLDPHDPYSPPGEYASMFKGPLTRGDYNGQMLGKIGLYDGEIRYLDNSLGELFAFLKTEKLFEDLIVVIVGDHGEQFNEHGFLTHGNTVFNVESHVPLLLKLGRDSPTQVVDHTVSTIDIFPTLLQAAGIAVPPQAVLAVPLLDKERQSARRGVMSKISRKLTQRAFVNYEGIKLIIGGQRDGEMFDDSDAHTNVVGVFDSRKDDQESSPIASYADLPELQADFADLMKAATALKGAAATGDEPISEDTLKHLKSLGYLK